MQQQLRNDDDLHDRLARDVRYNNNFFLYESGGGLNLSHTDKEELPYKLARSALSFLMESRKSSEHENLWNEDLSLRISVCLVSEAEAFVSLDPKRSYKNFMKGVTLILHAAIQNGVVTLREAFRVLAVGYRESFDSHAEFHQAISNEGRNTFRSINESLTLFEYYNVCFVRIFTYKGKYYFQGSFGLFSLEQAIEEERNGSKVIPVQLECFQRVCGFERWDGLAPDLEELFSDDILADLGNVPKGSIIHTVMVSEEAGLLIPLLLDVDDGSEFWYTKTFFNGRGRIKSKMLFREANVRNNFRLLQNTFVVYDSVSGALKNVKKKPNELSAADILTRNIVLELYYKLKAFRRFQGPVDSELYSLLLKSVQELEKTAKSFFELHKKDLFKIVPISAEMIEDLFRQESKTVGLANFVALLVNMVYNMVLFPESYLKIAESESYDFTSLEHDQTVNFCRHLYFAMATCNCKDLEANRDLILEGHELWSFFSNLTRKGQTTAVTEDRYPTEFIYLDEAKKFKAMASLLFIRLKEKYDKGNFTFEELPIFPSQSYEPLDFESPLLSFASSSFECFPIPFSHSQLYEQPDFGFSSLSLAPSGLGMEGNFPNHVQLL